METSFWKNCSSCKKKIPFSSKYYVCSVSTCNSKRKGLSFCSVSCFDRHLPGARHREAYALEEFSPSLKKYQSEQNLIPSEATRAPKRTIISSTTSSPAGISRGGDESRGSKEILIVASKLKNYIKQRADMNTSSQVMDRLSDKVRALCDDAIDEARSQGRKTVLDRDFK